MRVAPAANHMPRAQSELVGAPETIARRRAVVAARPALAALREPRLVGARPPAPALEGAVVRSGLHARYAEACVAAWVIDVARAGERERDGVHRLPIQLE